MGGMRGDDLVAFCMPRNSVMTNDLWPIYGEMKIWPPRNRAKKAYLPIRVDNKIPVFFALEREYRCVKTWK